MKKLTIITPLYNTKKEYLDDVFNSVKKFSDDIELVFINDSPQNYDLRKRLEALANYKYIKIYTHDRNKGIFSAYMTGYLNASGEYICILDHDDIFNPQNVLKAIELRPDLIYTDEYKYYYENGRKVIYDIYSKPDFDLLSSVSYFYTHHVTVLRTDIIKNRLKEYTNDKLFTSIFDIHMSLEYLTFLTTESKIVHIREADYGWRMHENSTASDLSQKISGYYERLKKVEEFYGYYSEMPRLRLNSEIQYLVDAFFTSTFDEFSIPIDRNEFIKKMFECREIKSERLKFNVLGEINKNNLCNYYDVLWRIPLNYLSEKRCLPLVIGSYEYMKSVDEKNYDKHVWGTTFISKTNVLPKDCIVISDKECEKTDNVYAFIEKIRIR